MRKNKKRLFMRIMVNHQHPKKWADYFTKFDKPLPAAHSYFRASTGLARAARDGTGWVRKRSLIAQGVHGVSRCGSDGLSQDYRQAQCQHEEKPQSENPRAQHDTVGRSLEDHMIHEPGDRRRQSRAEDLLI
jgi:hypothetical protein